MGGLLRRLAWSATARLYPPNEQAKELGPITIPYTDRGLRGELAFTFPDGEIFSGEYTTVDTSTTPYGRIFQTGMNLSSGAVGVGSGTAKEVTVPGTTSSDDSGSGLDFDRRLTY